MTCVGFSLQTVSQV